MTNQSIEMLRIMDDSPIRKDKKDIFSSKCKYKTRRPVRNFKCNKNKRYSQICQLMNTAHAEDRLRSQWSRLPLDYYYLFDRLEEIGKTTNLLSTYGYQQVMRYLHLLYHAQLAIVRKSSLS